MEPAPRRIGACADYFVIEISAIIFQEPPVFSSTTLTKPSKRSGLRRVFEVKDDGHDGIGALPFVYGIAGGGSPS